MKPRALLLILLLILCPIPASDAGAQAASATLVNGSDFDIYAMYLSPTHESHWGLDQLRKHVLESGTSFTLNGIPCGDYDLKLVDEDGDACVITEQNLCGDTGDWVLTNEALLECEGFQPTTAAAQLINQSRWDIHHLFLSPSRDPRWGSDQLGEYIFESGMSFTLSGLACDDYDLKLVDEAGDECILKGVYLCGAEQGVITDEDLLECQGYLQ